jgi:hypothetical protein
MNATRPARSSDRDGAIFDDRIADIVDNEVFCLQQSALDFRNCAPMLLALFAIALVPVDSSNPRVQARQAGIP